ncbi:HSP20 family (IbpA) (PDB:1GME) [Commensalibacter communis]|uniref:Hsp20 family protein n=1 Tax=Commensalibacter communis TaxID=2972786 RepID=UPI0022FF7550|nr:Hsp20 family protein [Commensalibacter communis]CAI3947783.1 HSP20 family (IbpA) (PDB:1GME) [Commensalibacter communis]CAI3949113.1 HSP20 family (IbpA) (PDB:1GME) [Commensalibacter communis]
MSGRLFTSPMFLGFDHLEQILERAAKSTSDGYPPYNIEQLDSSSLRITLAVAGFMMEDLQITQEDNQLVIRGRQCEDVTQERVFLYRGIAARQFQRAFVLAEGIEVESAWLDNGLLHIDIRRPQPEMKVRRIEIIQNSAARKKTAPKVPAYKGNFTEENRSERSGLERNIQTIEKDR